MSKGDDMVFLPVQGCGMHLAMIGLVTFWTNQSTKMV